MSSPAPGPWQWTGPRDGDLDAAEHIIHPPLPPERWPYCYATEHDTGCHLHSGGRFCDCSASANDDNLDDS